MLTQVLSLLSLTIVTAGCNNDEDNGGNQKINLVAKVENIGANSAKLIATMVPESNSTRKRFCIF